ncbi:MAG TPA: hypothetical protein VK858_00785 [Longimicrobiales bacterium]|nr:hypothetical protein [Longimicrobiales bacterium]
MLRTGASLLLLAALLTTSAPPTDLGAQQVPASAYDGYRFRHVGPEGNRAIAALSIPGDPLTWWIGAASGGVWKTEDGGASWRPTFDDQDVQSIGSLALAPTAPNEVWAGTGETFLIRPAVAMGNGIYKSIDGGETWEHKGLEATGRIGRIVVHPRDQEVVYACALGHAYGPQQDRGIYRTTDGGDTWERILFVDEGTGCADLAIDPTRPDILFAGMWSLRIDPWQLASIGTGGGVYVSRDGGDSWDKITGRGLPGADDPIGKVAVGIAPSDPDRVYALLELDHPTFYRSENGGRSWELVNRDNDMAERASYYTRFAIDPADPDRIYFASVRFNMSQDGGRSLVPDPPRGGGDTHDVWIDPTNPDRFMVADDGGATITLNRGRTFERIVLPIAQMYHVFTDNEIPYNLYGNRQDGWSYKGPSNSRAGGITPGHWSGVGGCESGFAIPDTAANNEVWSGCYDGGLEVFDPATGHARNVRVWPEAAYGWRPADLRYRWHWTFPVVISPHDNQTVYVGSQHVHRTRDQGASWEVISPDLTLNDKTKQQDSGGMTTDNLMTFDGSVLYALAESPVEEGVLWSGSNDGQIHVSRDGGGSWTNVSANIPDLPDYGQFANIEPSRWHAGTAYATVDAHQMADFDPYIYKTTDHGETWTRIDAGIERGPSSFVHVVREDPVRAGMLFAGTDNGVWFTLDDGENWMRLRNGLPAAPVYWLTVQPHFHDLVVGTYGRGYWILDNITGLRALDADLMAREAAVVRPLPAWRFQEIQDIKSTPTHVRGQNPAYGAAIDLWLSEGSAGPVRTEILDPTGDLVRTLETRGTPGLNRIRWDLRYESPHTPRLRTPPPDMPWIRMEDDGTRRLRTWDLDLTGGQIGPRAVPGTYTARIQVGDVTLETPVEVLKDPNTTGSIEDIRRQVALSLSIRDDLDEIGGMIDRLEWIREQVEDLQDLTRVEADAEAVAEAAATFREQLLEVEGRLFDLNLSGAREDAFRSPMRLYGRYAALGSDVSRFGADFAPTAQQQEVYEVLSERLEGAKVLMDELLNQALPRLNEQLRARGIPVIS